RSVSPNSSFKPTPLRYTKHMAGTACHALCSTTRRGLTQALGGTLQCRVTEYRGNRVGQCSSSIPWLRALRRKRAGTVRRGSLRIAGDTRCNRTVHRRLRPGPGTGSGPARPGTTGSGYIPSKSLSLPDFRRSVSPNSSFKPTPLRYTKHMAGTACHVFCSTTRRGLTQALGGTLQCRVTEYRGNRVGQCSSSIPWL